MKNSSNNSVKNSVLNALTQDYNAFCDQAGLPRYSFDEQKIYSDLTSAQYDRVNEFEKVWEAVAYLDS